jgi:hypothetical protein
MGGFAAFGLDVIRFAAVNFVGEDKFETPEIVPPVPDATERRDDTKEHLESLIQSYSDLIAKSIDTTDNVAPQTQSRSGSSTSK